MPLEGYPDVSDLPRSLKTQLPVDAQRVYQLAYNSALAEGKNTLEAEAAALGTVKTKWTPEASSHWVRKDA